jgi:hypothetical protein
MAKSTVSYHKRRIGLPLRTECNRRYDWREVQVYYDAGHTVRECAAHFGFSSKSWFDAVKRGAVIPRPQAMPLDQLLVKGRRGRYNIRRRLLSSGIKKPRCEECGIGQWRNRPLSLELHTATAINMTTGSRTWRSSARTATASRTRGEARTSPPRSLVHPRADLTRRSRSAAGSCSSRSPTAPRPYRRAAAGRRRRAWCRRLPRRPGSTAAGARTTAR